MALAQENIGWGTAEHWMRMQFAALRGVDHGGADAVGFPVLHPSYRNLAHGAAPGVQLWSACLLRSFPAEVSLVYFRRPVKQVGHVAVPRGADAVREVPSALLRDLQVAVQLHACELCGVEVPPPCPDRILREGGRLWRWCRVCVEASGDLELLETWDARVMAEHHRRRSLK